MSKWKSIARNHIKAMIEKEKSVWPPVCWGLNYEAKRPDRKKKK